jgi:hypothetical protein
LIENDLHSDYFGFRILDFGLSKPVDGDLGIASVVALALIMGSPVLFQSP